MIRPRNTLVQALWRASGPYKPKVVRSKRKYNRQDSNKVARTELKKQFPTY